MCGIASSCGPSKRASSGCLVVLPCFNEEASVKSTIEILKSNFDKEIGIDFLIIDDGSLDQSRQLLSQYVPNNFLMHKANIGVAGVLLTGFRYAQSRGYDYVIQCDSDGQHPIVKVSELLEHAKASSSDLLIGSRFLSGVKAGIGATTFSRVCGIYMLRISLGLFGRLAFVTDPTSGFRVYSRKAIDVLSRNMPDEYPEPESVAILSQARLNIGEYSVEMASRFAGVSSISGLRQLRYFAKVTAALVGLRLRCIFVRHG
jgi:glycosyltransferase involved in cell wall biosynthesis